MRWRPSNTTLAQRSRVSFRVKVEGLGCSVHRQAFNLGQKHLDAQLRLLWRNPEPAENIGFYLFVAFCLLLVKGVSPPTLNLLWSPVLKDGSLSRALFGLPCPFGAVWGGLRAVPVEGSRICKCKADYCPHFLTALIDLTKKGCRV